MEPSLRIVATFFLVLITPQPYRPPPITAAVMMRRTAPTTKTYLAPPQRLQCGTSKEGADGRHVNLETGFLTADKPSPFICGRFFLILAVAREEGTRIKKDDDLWYGFVHFLTLRV